MIILYMNGSGLHGRWMAWWDSYLDVLAAVGKLKVFFLGLPEFALEAFFVSRATELPSRIFPVAGPMVLNGVTHWFRVRCIQPNKGRKQLIDRPLVRRKAVLGDRDSQGRVYLHYEVVHGTYLPANERGQQVCCAEKNAKVAGDRNVPPPVDADRFEYPPCNPIREGFEPVSPTQFDIFVRSCFPGNVSNKRVHNPAGLQDTGDTQQILA